MRFGKHLIILTTLIGIHSSGVLAFEDPDKSWLDQSKQYIDMARDAEPPKWMLPKITPKLRKQVEEIFVKSKINLPIAPLQNDLDVDDSELLSVYVSLSIPENQFRELLQEASGRNIKIYFRGVPKGGKINDLHKEVLRILGDIRPIPLVLLDPTRFTDESVNMVPVMVMQNSKGRSFKISGVSSLTSFIETVKKSKPSDPSNLGVKGDIYPIAEADIVSEMKSRIMKVDWDKKKKDAMARYWTKFNDFVDLPPAEKNYTYSFDPTVEVTKSIKDVDGNVIVQAGTRVNPLSMIGFTKTIIVFNSMDKKQVSVAFEMGLAAKLKNRGVIYITTMVDREKGWDAFTEIENKFNAPVFLLKQDLVDRFGLEHVPSIITTANQRINIREIKVRGAQEISKKDD